MKNFKIFGQYLLSFISLLGFIYITNLNKNSIFINSILCIILYLCFFKIIKKYFFIKEKGKRLITFSIFISILLSISFVIGYNLTIYDKSYLEKFTTYLQIISIIPILVALTNLILINIDNWLKKINEINCKKINNILLKKHAYIKSFVLILIAWIPIFLAFYPGIFSYDSSVQLNEVMKGTLSNGNPILHTLLVGGCVKLGYSLFNSYNFGIAIYSVIQMILLASSFAFIINYFNKKKLPFLIKIVSLCLFMFLPTFSIMSVTTTKDVFFTAIINFLFPFLIEISTNTKEFIKSKKNIILIILLLTLTCIFRSNGYYAVLALFIFLLVGLRKYWKTILLIILITIGSYKSYLFGVNKILKTAPGISTAQNAILCIPIQQFGRLYTSNIKLTSYEKTMLDELLTKKDAYNLYESHKSDSIAWYFNGSKIYQNKIEYLKLYLKLGIKHPVIYIDSFLANTMGYWYVGDMLPDKGTYRTYIETRTRDDFNNTKNQIKFDSKIKWLYDIYYNVSEKASFQKVPILSLLMSVSFNIILLIILTLICIYQKKYANIIPLSLFYGLLFTLILGPVAILRYSFSIISCMTMIIYSTIIKK